MHRAATELKRLRAWRLSRQQARDARRRLTEQGDMEAAEQLLRHSIAYGHTRLVVRRLFLAQALGLVELSEYEPFCRFAIEQLEVNEIGAALMDARNFVNRLDARGARACTLRSPSG